MTNVLQLATEGKLDELKALDSNTQRDRFFFDLVMIGGHNGGHKTVQAWAFENNSSAIIWAGEHRPAANRALQMLGGPGEVKKGAGI
jgi:hypothetical protein